MTKTKKSKIVEEIINETKSKNDEVFDILIDRSEKYLTKLLKLIKLI